MSLLPTIEKLQDIVGQPQAISQIREYLAQFARLPLQPRFPLAILHGKAGIGKTSSVYAAALEYGYDIHGINASDARSYDHITKVLHHSAFGNSLLGKPKLILLDEIDGAFSTERNSIKAVLDFLARFPTLLARSPIIGTCNIPSAQELKRLKDSKEVQWIGFRHLFPSDMRKLLNNVSIQRRLGAIPHWQRDKLVQDAGGDVRQLANLLYLQRLRRGTGTKKDVGSSPFDVARIMLSPQPSPEDMDMGNHFVAAIIANNIPDMLPFENKNNAQQLGSLVEYTVMANTLSEMDIFMKDYQLPNKIAAQLLDRCCITLLPSLCRRTNGKMLNGPSPSMVGKIPTPYSSLALDMLLLPTPHDDNKQ